VVTSPEEKETRVIDLADALRRSVEAARKGGKRTAAAKGAPASARRRQTRPARRTRKVS